VFDLTLLPAGSEITVIVGSTVRLPFVPDVPGRGSQRHIPVDATYVTVVDRFREL
jgi:hypothetical protein